jgi:diguanylate cyclase (GGDEF)-like protein
MASPPAKTAAMAETARAGLDAAVLLRARLGEIAETSRGSVVANLANFICVVVVARSYALAEWGLLAGAGALLLSGLGWRLHISGLIPAVDDDTPDLAVLQRLRWHMTLSDSLLGLFWGLVSVGLLAFGPPDVQLFAGCVGAGMMSAGAITYRTLPRAALGWVFGSGLLAALGLFLVGTMASYVALGLLLCYILVLRDTILSNGQRFARAILQKRELQRSSETIQLLLNDFTEHGSDWLVEIDKRACIVEPCARFAEATRRPLETLVGLSFGELLDPGEARDALKDHFLKGRVIRRHIISILVDGETRWWSISARPVAGGRVAYRGVVTDITAQRQAEEKVSYLAHYDGLTDLPNRFLFNERLYRMLNRGSRRAGLLYVDLDNFKTINDTLGHPTGDRLLQAVARRLEGVAGKSALVARLGGDEFAILLPPSRIGGAQRIADRIVDMLSHPLSLGDHDVVIGASIGMALAPHDADTSEALMRMADLALYAAKGAGRGRALRFDPAMDVAAQARRQIEMDLRVAQADGQLRLHYQPLVNSATGDLIGCEALIRWVHPDRGVIMPDEFIGVAEETGLIIPIGEWAIRQALDDARDWPDHIEIAINLSPLQMRSPTLISTIVGALARTGIAPQRLCLEITETVLMQENSVNVETLHKLRGFGIQIALDDFGTGYSSLNYLRSFPFSKIKIDRCFVADVDNHAESRAIVGSVVDLAATLGMQTVAEGVERESQADALRAAGCGHVQGFLYSRAVPAEELTDLRPSQKQRLRA